MMENVATDETETNFVHYFPIGTAERMRQEEELRREAIRRRESEHEKSLLEQCTFRPQINTRSGDVMKNYTHQSAHVRLQKKGEEIREKRQQALEQKLKNEAKMVRDEFRPAVDRKSAKLSERMYASAAGISTADRLLDYGRKVEESRRERQDNQKEEEEAIFFNPHINNRRSRSAGAFANRAQTLLNDQAKRQADALRAEHEKYSFRPTIGPLSAKFGGDAQGGDRAEKLYNEAKQREEHLAEQRKKAREEEVPQAHPQTDRNSEEIVHRGQYREAFKMSFVERQQEFARIHEATKKKLCESIVAQETVAPSPVRVDPDMLEEQVIRLYRENNEISKAAKRELAMHRLEEQCPFAPTLSSGTKRIASHIQRQGNVVERLASARRSRSASTEVQQPVIDMSTDSASSRVSTKAQFEEFIERQKQSVEMKEERLLQLRALREIEKQTPCTFRPKTDFSDESLSPILSSRSQPQIRQPPKVIRGFDSHLKLQKQGRERQQESKKRFEELGKGLPCNGPNYTIVTPFNFKRIAAAQTLTQSKILGREKAAVKYSDPADAVKLLEAVRRQHNQHYHDDSIYGV